MFTGGKSQAAALQAFKKRITKEHIFGKRRGGPFAAENMLYFLYFIQRCVIEAGLFEASRPCLSGICLGGRFASIQKAHDKRACFQQKTGRPVRD